MLPVTTGDALASKKAGKFKKIGEIFITCMDALASAVFPL